MVAVTENEQLQGPSRILEPLSSVWKSDVMPARVESRETPMHDSMSKHTVHGTAHGDGTACSAWYSAPSVILRNVHCTRKCH